MNKKISTFIFVFLILAPAIFVFASFFKQLHLAWGDAPFYYPEGLKEISSGLPVWGQRGIDFGGRNLALWLSPLMAFYGSLHKTLGINNDFIIRIMFYFPSILLAGLGPLFLTRYLKFSKFVQFFASLIFLLNTYFILLIDGGQVGVALGYGFFPFIILFWKKFFDNKSAIRYFFAVLATFGLSLIDPRVMIVSLLFLMIWRIIESIVERRIRPAIDLIPLVLAGFAMLPFNFFWIFPLVKSGGLTLDKSVSGLKLSSLLNSLYLFAPNWPANEFGKVVPPFFYFSVVPILIFGSLWFKKIDKKIIALGGTFLIFAFFTNGTTPPFGNFYDLFINKVPFGSIFRDSIKFFIPLVLSAAILIGTTVDKISSEVKNKAVKRSALVLAYLYILLLIWPALTGKMNFNLSPRKESADYQLIYRHLNEDGDSFKTLWFNEKPQIAFETNQKPALSANQLISFRPFASINEGEDAYNFLNNPDFSEWLKVLGVKYVFLPGDTRNINPTETDVKNWAIENKLISQARGLAKENWGTDLPVYKVDNARPETYSVQKLALVVGSDLPLAEKMPATAYVEDGKFDPGILENIKPDSLKLVFNQGNKDDLAMSFLQKYFKSPSEAVSSEWSIYDTTQYLKFKYELLIRNFKLRDFDYGKGLAFSTKNSESIKYIFNVPADGDYVIAERTATSTNQKLSWTFTKKALKAGSFDVEVKNGSGMEVLNVVAVIPQTAFDDSIKLAEKYVSGFGTIKDGGAISEWNPVTKISSDGLTNVYKISEGDRWLIYTQNYHSDWKADSTAIHIPVFSMINGFYLDDKSTVKVQFAGDADFVFGTQISLVSILILVVSYFAYAFYLRSK